MGVDVELRVQSVPKTLSPSQALFYLLLVLDFSSSLCTIKMQSILREFNILLKGSNKHTSSLFSLSLYLFLNHHTTPRVQILNQQTENKQINVLRKFPPWMRIPFDYFLPILSPSVTIIKEINFTPCLNYDFRLCHRLVRQSYLRCDTINVPAIHYRYFDIKKKGG